MQEKRRLLCEIITQNATIHGFDISVHPYAVPQPENGAKNAENSEENDALNALAKAFPHAYLYAEALVEDANNDSRRYSPA